MHIVVEILPFSESRPGTKSREVAQYFENFSELKVTGTKSRGTKSRGTKSRRNVMSRKISKLKPRELTIAQNFKTKDRGN